ncbi:MAG: PAS domain S-box protein [Nitrospinae bacterium]|nr:PAS domain S-box protein [Nitrospinota bacterium]
MRLKIRTKIILSFFAPIIPLTSIMVIVSGYILNNLYNEAQRLDDISKQRIKVTDLRFSLNEGLMPGNDYIITGNKKYADDFKGISKEIEERFKAVEDIARTSETKELLKNVKNSWQNIKEISLKIFSIPEPAGNKDAGILMEEMDYKWGYPAIERIKRWMEIDLQEYKDVLEKHHKAWKQLWITMTAGIIIFLTICTIYILIYSKIASRNEEELRLHGEIERNMAEAVYLIRVSDGVIVYTNPFFERLFGYEPGELVGKHVSIVNAPGDKSSEAVANEIISTLMRTGVWNGEIRNIRKDGTTFWCHANVLTFEHPRYGRVWLSMHQDITERKKAEELLNQRLDELERFQKVAVKREFRIRELQERVKEMEGR